MKKFSNKKKKKEKENTRDCQVFHHGFPGVVEVY